MRVASQTFPFVVNLQALSGLNMVLSIGQRDHKEVAAPFPGNRSSLVHDAELFLGQHHIVPVKQGFGCLELYALEWRRLQSRIGNQEIMHMGYEAGTRMDNQVIGGFVALTWRIS